LHQVIFRANPPSFLSTVRFSARIRSRMIAFSRWTSVR
jgi:hypothetical protein